MNVLEATIAAAIVLLATACGSNSDASSPVPDTVTTDVGQLHGVVDGDVVRFRGVPFAKSPVGALRWAPPQPIPAWPGVREATKSTSPCSQPAQNQDYPQDILNEDCLYLEVTAPTSQSRKGSNRPVMVWAHGGGFVTGAASEYNPQRMVLQGDVVVVTIDYRLGAMGFLALPGLTGGGAFGLADQQEALRFVRRNVAAFGGDPNNITFFGESAGGLSTCMQLTSPAARGLFHRAIVESGGPCLKGLPAGGLGRSVPAVPYVQSRAAADQMGLAAAARLGCTDPATALACMRALPVNKVLTEHQTLAVAAYGGDDALLPSPPLDAMLAGNIANVPVLAGYNRDESRLFHGLVML
ncbi:MAG TPA: carboxylesterase family protein, partial [Polyangiaceae bacterium]|nr:carboxylesterase family protein [Polyangiaceae bacterium]